MNQQVRMDNSPIPFIDVAAQRRRLGRAIDDAIARVLGHCQFILGPEVRQVEADLAAFCGARHAITCASGTDSLLMPLMAKGIGPGDAVFTPAFTFYATAEVAARRSINLSQAGGRAATTAVPGFAAGSGWRFRGRQRLPRR